MDRPHESLRPVLKAKRRDRELEAGARAHFEDAAYYASTYAERAEDVAYYVALARKANPDVMRSDVPRYRPGLEPLFAPS